MSNNNGTHPKSNISEIIQAVCSIITLIIISTLTIIISNESNELSKKANELTKYGLYPYFSIEMNEDRNEYIINNEGGFMQNASVIFTRMINIKNSTSKQSVYFPYKTNEENFYEIKNSSFSVRLPLQLSNTEELGELFKEYFHLKGIDISCYYFDCLTISYFDINHSIKTDKYIIGSNYIDNNFKYFLSPMSREIEEEIIRNSPNDSEISFISFPYGTRFALENASSKPIIRGRILLSPEQELNKYVKIVEKYFKN